MARAILRLASAVLGGAAGLGLETLLLSSAGLALGYGRSEAFGLAVFVAGWAAGARYGGRARRPVRAILTSGALLAALAAPALWVVIEVGGALASALAAGALALATIGALAFLQGTLLTLVAQGSRDQQGRERPVALLVALNLAGAVLGAWLLGDVAAAAFGRVGAAAAAGALAALSALCGAAALRAPGARADLVSPAAAETPASPDSASAAARPCVLSPRAAAAVIGLSTAAMLALQWVSLRLAVLWLGGMQPALSAVLCATLASLALGAALLPPLVPRDARGVAIALVLAGLSALWPFAAADALAGSEHLPLFVRALVLVGPVLLPLGALVPLCHRALGLRAGPPGRRLGALYLHEAWGALLGVVLAHELVVPAFGLGGAIAASIVLGALALGALAQTLPRGASAGAVLLFLSAALAARLAEPALRSPPIANPALSVQSFVEDRPFAVTVVDDGLLGERTLLTDGFRAAGTGDDYRYMRVLGHLPVLWHPAPRRVAVLALGTGTTVGAVALHPEVLEITVFELSRAVVEAAPWFVEKNRGVLAEGLPGVLGEQGGARRVRVELGDGRRRLAEHPGEFDVLTLEPLLPDAPSAVYLYTPGFYRRARAALAPGGLVCQWVPPHALEPGTFAAVLEAFATSFPWSSVWIFGTQVILLGGEREPSLEAPRPASLADGADERRTVLASALAELGLEGPAGRIAHWVCDGSRVPRAERKLSDVHPWVIHRAAREGRERLLDLPENLARLRASACEPPAAWLALADGARERWQGLRALAAAREAHAREEARLRGAVSAARGSDGEPDLERELGLARALAGSDPEVRQLEAELAFLGALRAGVSALAADRSPGGALQALPELLRAAELRGARADVHLYLAVALERRGSAGAAKALAAALERCPRIARTPEGARARELGLSAEAWDRLVAAAARAAEPAVGIGAGPVREGAGR